jgi:hypothetical protein
MKLLVNSPAGWQDILQVGEGGGYFDPLRVLWDERIDGTLPAITLGGMYRVDNTLVFSQDVMDSSLACLLDAKKLEKIQALKAYVANITKPRVASGLGYDVDGGRDNKDDFFSKWESMLDTDVTTVRDADNAFHVGITKAQMQLIYRAIVANGEALLTFKWQKEVEINTCTTLAELDAVVV